MYRVYTRENDMILNVTDRDKKPPRDLDFIDGFRRREGGSLSKAIIAGSVRPDPSFG
jgi:hypothetical protein